MLERLVSRKKSIVEGPNISRLLYLQQKIGMLSKNEKDKLLGHDVRGEYFQAVSGFAEKLHYKDSPNLEVERPARKAADYLLGASIYIKEKLNEVRISENRKKRIMAYLDILPSLTASAIFLDEPTSNNYLRLISQKVNAKNIGIATGCNVAELPDNLLVNGFDAVIAFNAAKNAVKYGENKLANMQVTSEGNLLIENKSLTDLPENYLSFGVKGENGGTGMGMGIIEVYSAVQGRSHGVSHNFLSEENKYHIEVTVPTLV